MRVTISVNGRFHAFDLAKQLNDRHHLDRIITTYPKSKVMEWGIPRKKIISLLPIELLKRVCKKMPIISKRKLTVFQKKIFEKWASHYIPKSTQVFIGWSGSSLRCIRKAKGLGIKTVLERGSSHIEHQTEILIEEYKRFNMLPNVAPREIINKELYEYKESDYISIPSSFVRRSFLNKGILDDKLIQIPYGVELKHFKKVKKEDNIFRIIYAGGLTIRKGAQYLLQAVYELIGLENIEFWHLGTISEACIPLVHKFKSNKIKFLGHKPQKELYKFYSQGSLFVMPSLEEGLSQVQVQAMACGLPLICTTNTGGEDISEDFKEGFVLPIRDKDAIKDKIYYLYQNPELCLQMGTAAMKKVQAGFSWDDYGDKYVTFLDKIVNEN